MPDPAHLLYPATIDALRASLIGQRESGREPTPAVSDAIRVAAHEARERRLPPEALVIQLKALADEVGLPPISREPAANKEVREWMITACLRAYWDSEPKA